MHADRMSVDENKLTHSNKKATKTKQNSLRMHFSRFVDLFLVYSFLLFHLIGILLSEYLCLRARGINMLKLPKENGKK